METEWTVSTEVDDNDRNSEKIEYGDKNRRGGS